MATIISHGTGKWGRANKHKRKDEEMESEIIDSQKSVTKKPIQNADLVKKMTEEVNIGETVIKKINNNSTDSKSSTTVEISHIKNVQDIVNSRKLSKNNIQQKKNVENKIDESLNSNDFGISFLEDIDGWEEKLKLLNLS